MSVQMMEGGTDGGHALVSTNEQQRPFLEDQASCSITCPHCNRPIAWKHDGTVWRSHCVDCAKALLGSLADNGCIEAVRTSDGYYLNPRGV